MKYRPLINWLYSIHFSISSNNSLTICVWEWGILKRFLRTGFEPEMSSISNWITWVFHNAFPGSATARHCFCNKSMRRSAHFRERTLGWVLIELKSFQVRFCSGVNCLGPATIYIGFGGCSLVDQINCSTVDAKVTNLSPSNGTTVLLKFAKVIRKFPKLLFPTQ